MRWLEFVALVLLIGAVSFRVMVVARIRERAPFLHAWTASRTGLVGLSAATALFLAGVARLVIESPLVRDAASPNVLSHMYDVLSATRWGHGRLLQLIGSSIAVVALGRAGRSRREGDAPPGVALWWVATLAAVACAVTPALAGHAGASERLRPFAIVADALHVLAAGVWMGGLLVLVVVVLPGLRSLPDNLARTTLPVVVTTFSSVVVMCVATLVTTGGLAAWLHLGSLRALWESAYGRTLALKLAVLLPLLGTGAYHWRLVLPALGEPAGARRLRRNASLELLAGVIVLLVTAVLVAVQPPK